MASLLLRISLAFTLTAAFVACGPTSTLAQRVPDLSRVDYTTRHSLELACILSQSHGPAAYGRCLNEQINALRDSPGIPSLSGLDYTTRHSIELACILQNSQGPVAYGNCLRAQLHSNWSRSIFPSCGLECADSRCSSRIFSYYAL
jgi:hypothetical protein